MEQYLNLKLISLLDSLKNELLGINHELSNIKDELRIMNKLKREEIENAPYCN